MTKRRNRFESLLERLRRERPDLASPETLIAAGRVRAGGMPILNPRALVPTGAALTIDERHPLRGTLKLRHALAVFGVPVAGRVAVDLGASTGGFTTALLEAGARRVYAVDAGHGQLLGSLRQDPRVVCLERTNLGALGPTLVPEAADVVTIDLAYLALARAAPQLDRLALAPNVDLVALVKPMYELGLSAPPDPSDEASLGRALALAVAGFAAAGWRAVASTRSPIAGGRGTTELLLHAVRR